MGCCTYSILRMEMKWNWKFIERMTINFIFFNYPSPTFVQLFIIEYNKKFIIKMDTFVLLRSSSLSPSAEANRKRFSIYLFYRKRLKINWKGFIWIWVDPLNFNSLDFISITSYMYFHTTADKNHCSCSCQTFSSASAASSCSLYSVIQVRTSQICIWLKPLMQSASMTDKDTLLDLQYAMLYFCW